MNNDLALTQDLALRESDSGAISASTLFLNDGAMDRLYKVAETMAAGIATVPKHLQKNVADCFAVVTQAAIWRMNPYAVAQKTHISQGGALGYEGQLVNAVVTTLAPIQRRPEYEFLGDWSKILGKVEERKSDKGGKYYVAAWKTADEAGLGVIVRCTLKGETEPRTVQVMMTQAWPRFSTQWATDPQQQICYLAVRKWSRRYTPDVLLGVYTPEEQNEIAPRDMGPVDEVGKGRHAEPPKRPEAPQALIDAAKAAAEKGVAAYQAFWSHAGKDNRGLLAQQHEGFKTTAIDADKARTVDAPAPPAADTNAPLATATSATDATVIDAETGEIDPFVAALDKAEREQQ